MRDVQSAVLAKVRATGIDGNVTIFVSDLDLRLIFEDLGLEPVDLHDPGAPSSFIGPSDDTGTLTWKRDWEMPKGVGRIESKHQEDTLIHLDDLIA